MTCRFWQNHGCFGFGFTFDHPDLMADTKEASEIFKIEDALTQQPSRSCGAVLSGRITTDGRRELYFYGETRTGFSRAVARAMSDFEAYDFEIGEQEDSLWEQYLNVLYPSAEDLQKIKNRDLLDVLEQKGDVLTAARDVKHWMYFASETARSSFRKAAVEAGFRIASESRVDGGLPFGISVVRNQAVEEALIDATVIELLHLTQRFQGEYDGWETPLITQ